MITKLNGLFNHVSKAKIVVFALVVLLFSLVKCSTVQYQAACVPHLNYELPVGTPFTLMDFRNYPKDYIINKGLKARIAFQEPEENAPDTAGYNYNTTLIKSSQLRLLGPVLNYIRSPYNLLDNSFVYFYVEIDDQHAWVTGDGLLNLSQSFTNDGNQLNETIIRKYIVNPVENNNTLTCATDNSAYLPIKNNIPK